VLDMNAAMEALGMTREEIEVKVGRRSLIRAARRGERERRALPTAEWTSQDGVLVRRALGGRNDLVADLDSAGANERIRQLMRSRKADDCGA
jgi:hypothetical protein